MKLPLRVAIELVQRIEDLFAYELTVEVPGSDASTTTALIESNLDGDANITTVKTSGLPLDDAMRDQLLLRVFKLAHDEMLSNDGSGIEWWMSDISGFLASQFTAADVATISFAISSFVDPALEVANKCVVRID